MYVMFDQHSNERLDDFVDPRIFANGLFEFLSVVMEFKVLSERLLVYCLEGLKLAGAPPFLVEHLEEEGMQLFSLTVI